MGKLKQIKPNVEQFNDALGIVLRQLRTKANLSQPELAERVSVHLNTISNYERGMGIPTVLFLRVCVELGKDAGKVLRDVIARANDE